MSGGGTALQDLNYSYDSDGNILTIKSVASTTASTTVHYTYDTLNRLTNAYTNVGPGITTVPHQYWNLNGTSTDSVQHNNGVDTAMSYASSTGVIPKGAVFNGSTSKIDIGTVASGTVNLSVGAWVMTTSTNSQMVIAQRDVGVVNGQWQFLVNGGKVGFYTEGSGHGMGDILYGNTSVNDGKWHYIGASQSGATYTIYVDGVVDAVITAGTPVSYDPNLAAGIGYNRRDAANYFSGYVDEIGVWTSTLSTMDFVTLYNAGSGYGYPYSVGSLASTTYSPQSYIYDALGNLTVKGANIYTYAGTGYANPDAVTQIANGVSTTSLSYDNNGNLTSSGSSTFSWDYNIRMTQAVTGSTSTYAYDYAGNRVSQTVGSTTTIYPNKFYSITSTTNGGTTYATTTVYVWNGDTLIATIDQPMVNGSATGTAAMRYIHPDHLGSTNIVSDTNGNIVQDVENYPYGETRLNEATYPTNEQRQYIAQFKDGNSLSYLNARYYNPSQGQFLSEDPVFLATGDENKMQQLTGQDLRSFLSNPQQMNSYAYANDNPMTHSDPSGNQVAALLLLGLEAYGGIQLTFDGVDIAQTNFIYSDVFTPKEKSQSVFKGGFDAATTIIGGSAARVGLKDAGRALSVLGASGDALDQFFGKQIYGPDNALHRDKKDDYQPVDLVQAMGGNGSSPTSLTTFTSRGTTGVSQSNMHSSGGGSSTGYAQFIASLSQFVSSLSSYLAGASASKSNTK
jgi:RHS repeat-associated protein